MTAERRAEAGADGDAVGDDGRRDLVHVGAAVLLGNVDIGDADLARLLQQVARDLIFLVLDLLDRRDDLLARELFSRLCDLLVLFSEIFGSEDFVRITLFQKPASAGDFYFRDCCCCCHVSP